LEKVLETASHVNESIRRQENSIRLAELQSVFPSVEIVKAERVAAALLQRHFLFLFPCGRGQG
jgi:hypothetical protein